LALRAAGGEHLNVLGSGNVGIGTSSPGVPLDVVGAIRSQNGTIDARLQAGYSGAIGIGAQSNDAVLFIQNATERARIDTSGRLLVGTSSGVSAAFVNSSIQAHGLTGDSSSVTLYRFTTSATAAAAPRLVMARSGSDSKDFTVVASGNRLGQLNFVGADGTQFVSAASIDCEVDGTPGANDMPGRLVLSTTSDGASSPTERMRIDSNGFARYTGAIGRGAPVTKAGAFTVGIAENWLICNGTASITVTLPTASAWTGREIMLKTIAAFTVVSTSSNVVPLAGGAAGTAILAATAGRFATLVSDGTNWIIMQAN
jgi:hypothetical protein